MISAGLLTEIVLNLQANVGKIDMAATPVSSSRNETVLRIHLRHLLVVVFFFFFSHN